MTTQQATTLEAKAVLPAASETGLAMVVRAEETGPILAESAITVADLFEVMGEYWMNRWLRMGHPGVGLRDLDIVVTPIPDKNNKRLLGYAMESRPPDKGTQRAVFTLYSQAWKVPPTVNTLREKGVLKVGQNYCYELTELDPSSPAEESIEIPCRGKPYSPNAPAHISLPLQPLLECSTGVDLELNTGAFPVFFTGKAFKDASHFCQKGFQVQRETGVTLIGELCACPESGEFFVCVLEALEIVDPTQQTVASLEYSDTTWTIVERILKERHKDPRFGAHRMVGCGHLHPFPPCGGDACVKCPKRDTCNVTSAFMSGDDHEWAASIMFRKPWKLSQVFGLDARGNSVSRLFGLCDGRMMPRPYYLLPEKLDPKLAEAIGVLDD